MSVCPTKFTDTHTPLTHNREKAWRPGKNERDKNARAAIAFFPFFTCLCHRSAIFSLSRAPPPISWPPHILRSRIFTSATTIVFLHPAATARRKRRAFRRLRSRGTVKSSAWFRHHQPPASGMCKDGNHVVGLFLLPMQEKRCTLLSCSPRACHRGVPLRPPLFYSLLWVVRKAPAKPGMYVRVCVCRVSHVDALLSHSRPPSACL